MTYADFLASKAIRAMGRGLSNVPTLAGHLFPFQRSCVDFALRAGSAGNFLSTGLGKTACELEWSAHAADASNGKSLILAPLSVGWQIAGIGSEGVTALKLKRKFIGVELKPSYFKHACRYLEAQERQEDLFVAELPALEAAE